MIFILIGFLFLFYMFPAQLATSITKWSKEPQIVMRKVKTKSGRYVKKEVKVQPKLETGETITSIIPIMSACQVWRTLYGSFGWTKFVAALVPLGILFRVAVVFLSENSLLFIVSFYVLWVCLLLHQLLYTIVYFVTARMYSCGIFTQILCIVLPEFAAYPLMSNVPKVIKELREEDEESFGE